MYLAAILVIAQFFEFKPVILQPFKTLEACMEFIDEQRDTNRIALNESGKELVCLQVIRSTI